MGLHISATGIANALRRQRITANNVANISTTGYRAAETGGQGPLVPTGRPLDVASGAGFFQVELADGTTAYTRDGSFGLNAEGEVVTADGARLVPPIQAPPNATSVTVGRDGQVYATTPGDLDPRAIGRIEVFTFPNAQGLQSAGGNLFTATPASGAALPVEAPVQSGMLEGSNVDLAREQVNTALNINQVRANANAFRAQADMLGELLDLTR